MIGGGELTSGACGDVGENHPNDAGDDDTAFVRAVFHLRDRDAAATHKLPMRKTRDTGTFLRTDICSLRISRTGSTMMMISSASSVPVMTSAKIWRSMHFPGLSFQSLSMGMHARMEVKKPGTAQTMQSTMIIMDKRRNCDVAKMRRR